MSLRLRTRTRLTALAAAASVAAATLLASPLPAHAYAVASDATNSYDAVWCMAWAEGYNNVLRNANGRSSLPGFPWDGSTGPKPHDLLYSGPQGGQLGWAVHMAGTGVLAHDPQAPGDMKFDGATVAGQNVGQWVWNAPSGDLITSCVNAAVAIASEPAHLSNILDGRWVAQATGAWFDERGDTFMSQGFSN